MSLQETLEEKRTAILDRWIQGILETYPGDTATFLRRQKDQFANPVGHAVHEGTEQIFDCVIRGDDPMSVAEQLDGILRIRAVQHFSPARAMAFLFELKDAIATELKAHLKDAKLAAELRLLERRMDTLALLGMDIYTRCREQVYEIRLAELRNQNTDVKERILAKQGKWEKLAKLQGLKRDRGEAVTLPVLHSDVGADPTSPTENAPEEPGDADQVTNDGEKNPTAK